MRKHNLGECEGESMSYHVQKDVVAVKAGNWKQQLVSRMQHCKSWGNSILYSECTITGIWQLTLTLLTILLEVFMPFIKYLYHPNFLTHSLLEILPKKVF